jgi:hypothetical protein
MPKKRKAKKKQPTQKQSQRQSVVVNIGSTRKPRKASGKGGLPPPSYGHNLAPTFVTAPQVDYTPLLAMMQHNASRLVAQEPVAATQTPLSSTLIASNAEQMAGEAAIRRAGRTADNFQPAPSVADNRRASSLPYYPIFTPGSVPVASPRKKKTTNVVASPAVRPPDPLYTKTLQDLSDLNEGIAVQAEATPKRGRPRKKGVTSAEATPRSGSVPSRLPKQSL